MEELVNAKIVNENIIANRLNYDFEEVEIIDSTGKALGEFDGIDMTKKVFIEDKSALGIYRVNPRTGIPTQTMEQWAEKQIFKKSVTRIENLRNFAVSTRATKEGSQIIPSLTEIKDFKALHFKIDNNAKELIKEVQDQLVNLAKKYPD